MSDKETKKLRSAQLYSMRDVLSQVSWLCQVLEEFAQLHRPYVEGIGREDDEKGFYAVQKRVLEQFAKGYKGTNGHLENVFKCFEQLSDDVSSFANVVRCDSEWQKDEDDWGIRFLELLDEFHSVFHESITTFLRTRGGATDADLEQFKASHEGIQNKLADLLHFTYDWDTKMGSSVNKQRIQRDFEWTRLCKYCVWVTTSWDDEHFGPLDRLYAKSMTQKEKLEKELQAFVLDCTLDAKENIHNRRDGVSQAGAGAGVRVKGATKKARASVKYDGQTVQMTELLGALRACLN